MPPRATSWVWPAALLAALALIAGMGAMLVWRRKAQKLPDAPFERPVVPAPAPATPPAPALPSPPADAAPLDVALESVRMSASLVNATLAYRLSLTAQADTGPTEVRVQMTSAHASRAPEEQFAAAEVPPSHRLAGLQAGQATVLEGEIRLPLAAITPIRNGNFALFVPLVRIDAAAAMGDSSLDVRRAYVVGLDEGAPGARLQPFRLDLGPRVYPRIGQRELTLPAFS
ncbi:MAG: hypothetical protein NTX28_04455 [Novosphingobium sp.]|nr:hypothetical protein [Novosphingobium sp.]